MFNINEMRKIANLNEKEITIIPKWKWFSDKDNKKRHCKFCLHKFFTTEIACLNAVSDIL